MKVKRLNESKTGYQYKGYIICYGYKDTDRWYVKDSSNNFVGTKSGYSTEVEAKEYVDSLNESASINENNNMDDEVDNFKRELNACRNVKDIEIFISNINNTSCRKQVRKAFNTTSKSDNALTQIKNTILSAFEKFMEDNHGWYYESIDEAVKKREPKFWNTNFSANVIKDYEAGKLTFDNIEEWDTAYNDGKKPNPPFNTKEILDYYIANKSNNVNESVRPSQTTLDDCLRDYLNNAFGYNGVEDYVDTQYPMHPQEFKAEVVNYIKERKNESLSESKGYELKESRISDVEPNFHLQGKSSHTFTKDKKWEVDFDENGNILARTRHGKPSYFKGHINDKTSDFPSTDEDNIILAAREQHRLKFGELKEASYGGAFDIADDQYFTREDIENAAEEVMNHIDETFYEKYILGGTWFEKGRWIVNVQSEDRMYEFEDKLFIDMRKIRRPEDLKNKYALDMAAKLIAKIKSDTQPITEEYTANFRLEGESGTQVCKADSIKELVTKLISRGYQLDKAAINKLTITNWDKEAEENTRLLIHSGRKSLEVVKGERAMTGYTSESLTESIMSNQPEGVSEEDYLKSLVGTSVEYANKYMLKGKEKHKGVITGIKNDNGDIYATVHWEFDETIHPSSLEALGSINYIEPTRSTYGPRNTSTNECLTEDLEGPKEGPEYGLSSLLNDAIQDEFKTIDLYNTLAVTARAEGFENIAKVIEEINVEENRHVGQLQEALKLLSPNASAIDDGEVEGQEQLANPIAVNDDISDDDLAYIVTKI